MKPTLLGEDLVLSSNVAEKGENQTNVTGIKLINTRSANSFRTSEIGANETTYNHTQGNEVQGSEGVSCVNGPISNQPRPDQARGNKRIVNGIREPLNVKIANLNSMI